MIRIAIVDDNLEDQKHIESCLAFLAEKDHLEFSVEKYSSGDSFLFHYERNFDVVLMDIDMPGRNGLETARALRLMDENVMLIFLTALAQYAIQGYEVHAMSYIMKPVNKYDLAMKLSRTIHRIGDGRNKRIPIYVEKTMHMVSASAIRYAEVHGHYVTWHTTNGPLTEYGSLKSAEAKLTHFPFARCCRYYLANLRYVTSVTEDEVQLGDTHLLLSQSQRKEFLSALSKYIGGNE